MQLKDQVGRRDGSLWRTRRRNLRSLCARGCGSRGGISQRCPGADRTAAKVREAGRRALVVKVDVSEETAVREMFASSER